jgi:hypothetical protein
MVGGLVVLPVLVPLGFGVVAFAIGLTAGVVSLVFSLSFLVLALSLGLISLGFCSIPLVHLWFELRDIDQRGIQETGWQVVPFEHKPIFGVLESSWKWNVEYEIKDSKKEWTQEVPWTDIKTDHPWVQENIINLYKRVGLKTLMYAKQQGIQEQKGFLSLEKDWLWFRYRLPIHVDWVRKELQ